MRILIIACLGVLVVTGCGRKDVDRDGNIRLRGERRVVLDGQRHGDQIQSGTASWYGEPYHGRQTSNGEVYDMYQFTAAHKTLPFDTYVKVVNKNNGRTVIVRINDRGPFIKGRIIDLSRRAAEQIDMIGTGTAPVELYLEKAAAGQSAQSGNQAVNGFWTIQVGSFRERQRARGLEDLLRAYRQKVFIKQHQGFYRVRVGHFRSKTAAGDLAEALRMDGFDVWVLFQND